MGMVTCAGTTSLDFLQLSGTPSPTYSSGQPLISVQCWCGLFSLGCCVIAFFTLWSFVTLDLSDSLALSFCFHVSDANFCSCSTPASNPLRSTAHPNPQNTLWHGHLDILTFHFQLPLEMSVP